MVLSTFTDWTQVGRWKEALRRPCWQCTPDVRAVVDRVTAGLNTPAAKARALTYWVRRNIRYVSAGERHDYTPHPPAQVLANRFGDCKDTTQLLAVLLREAGVRVELATLGTRDDGQIHADVPSPWGTHAILLATIDGKPHWIDTTITLAAWDFLPRDDRDRLCYLTDEKGTLRLVRTPAATADDSRTDATTNVTVESDGRSRCRRTVISNGAAAMAQRDLYLETPPGERRRLLTGELQDAISRTRLLALTIDEKALGDFDRPVTITSEFEIPGHFAGETELEGNVTDSRVWGKLLAYTFDHDRQTPLELPSAFVSTHVYRFHAPATHQVDGPPRDRTLRSPWGTFSVRSRFVDDGEKGRSLELTFHDPAGPYPRRDRRSGGVPTFQDDVNRAIACG
ncbi:MAG: transglutaminase-like domain-containing protein [Gemmataceae bacterium]